MMTHNDFDFYEDLIRPLMKFLIQMNILTTAEELSDEGVGSESEGDCDEKLIDTAATSKARKTTESSLMKETQKMKHLAEGNLFQLNQVKFDEEFFIPPSMKSTY